MMLVGGDREVNQRGKIEIAHHYFLLLADLFVATVVALAVVIVVVLAVIIVVGLVILAGWAVRIVVAESDAGSTHLAEPLRLVRNKVPSSNSIAVLPDRSRVRKPVDALGAPVSLAYDSDLHEVWLAVVDNGVKKWSSRIAGADVTSVLILGADDIRLPFSEILGARGHPQSDCPEVLVVLFKVWISRGTIAHGLNTLAAVVLRLRGPCGQ
mmetsp:Transcript_5529/g.16779  ORF Transcript_5529/g.16779 Transcript_5529/m.16779 type:complete len:211 (+) Transcript_5529:1272-1904(+)